MQILAVQYTTMINWKRLSVAYGCQKTRKTRLATDQGKRESECLIRQQKTPKTLSHIFGNHDNALISLLRSWLGQVQAFDQIITFNMASAMAKRSSTKGVGGSTEIQRRQGDAEGTKTGIFGQ